MFAIAHTIVVLGDQRVTRASIDRAVISRRWVP